MYGSQRISDMQKPGLKMRLNRWARTLLWVCLVGYGQSALATDILFDVKIPLTDTEIKLSKQDQFEQALAKAAQVELMRLTGRLDVKENDDFQELLNAPKVWLSRYSYEPIIQEGVAVGTQIEFIFDKKHIYQYFQKHNLVLWPYGNRPKTLVFGSQKLGNDTVILTKDALENNPNLNYQKPAERLGIPVLEPDVDTPNSLWVFPKAEVAPEKIIYLISQVQANYLLSFQEELSETGDKQFYWALYDKQGKKVLSGEADNIAAIDNLEDVFSKLLDFYSQGYRAEADILGSVTLTLGNVTTVEHLNQVETALNNLKPMVHSVRLQTLKDYSANFEIIYQGIYGNLLTKIQNIRHLEVTDNDALIGMIKSKWLAEIPEQAKDASQNQSGMTSTGQQNDTPADSQQEGSETQKTSSPAGVQTEGAVIEVLPSGESINP